MPPEPKRSIDELLKASAEARRAQFGDAPQMPNPMRARLHEEIARQNRAAETPARGSWLARFWPQLSLASAVAGALILAAVVWLKPASHQGNMQLAIASAPSNAPADASAVLKSLPGAPQVAQARTEEAEAASSLTSDRLAMRKEAAPPPEPNAAAGLTSPAAEFASRAPGQMLRNQAPQSPGPQVLERFQVEQEGRQIRLVDADGSTYAGEVVPENAKGGTALAAAPASARTFAAKAKIAAGVSFRVSGFNTRLQKNVVVEGNYIAPAPNEQKKTDQAAEPEQARVIGTAQVAGEAPVRVDAVPIER